MVFDIGGLRTSVSNGVLLATSVEGSSWSLRLAVL